MLFGIDLGGTKTEGVVLHPSGEEFLRLRVPTVKGSYAACLTTIEDLVSSLEQESGHACKQLGIGIPGSVSPRTGLVRNGNSTWLNGKPLQDDLTERLARPVRLANDANCFALSEARDGAAKGAAAVFAVILGTGVGGGIVFDGKIVEGAHGIGGEWGHMPLPEQTNGPDCFCGRKGCVETYLAGPSVVRLYRESGGERVAGLEELVALAENEEPLALSALALFRKRLGLALGVIVNTIDPDVFVLGGGVSNLPGLVQELPDLIAPHVFAAPSDQVRIEVVKARWGDSSGVRGAAWLWGSG